MLAAIIIDHHVLRGISLWELLLAISILFCEGRFEGQKFTAVWGPKSGGNFELRDPILICGVPGSVLP